MSDRPTPVRVTWVKSAIGYSRTQKRTISALGLRRLQQTVEHPDSPALRGMITAVRHLVRVEGAAPGSEAAAPTGRRR
ncbi:MAG: 50S ribosomal protein L30 [Candidatus Dormibacteria bacterium]